MQILGTVTVEEALMWWRVSVAGLQSDPLRRLSSLISTHRRSLRCTSKLIADAEAHVGAEADVRPG